MKPTLLLIETASEVCSVAISRGEEILVIEESIDKQDHVAMLVVYIQNALKKTDIPLEALDAVVVSAGPGSYTGLRVGAATGKALCFALDIPLIDVSTLESLAYAARSLVWEEALYFPMIDARRMEIYTAAFDHDINRLTEDFPLVVDQAVFDPLLEAGEKIVFSGNGTHKCIDLFRSKDITILNEIRCSASHMLIPALKNLRDQAHADLRYFTPNYVKAPNITKRRKTLI